MGKKCVFSERGAFWNFQSATREFASQKETRLDADWHPAECVFRCFNHIAQINPHQPDFQRREMISGRSGLICATWLKQRKNAFRGDACRDKTPFALGNDFSCGGWRIPKCPAFGKYAFFASASRQTLRLSRKTRSEAKINHGRSQKATCS